MLYLKEVKNTLSHRKKSPHVSIFTLEIHKKTLMELLMGKNLFVTLPFCSDITWKKVKPFIGEKILI